MSRGALLFAYNNPKVDYWNYVVFHSLYDKIAGEILKLENTSKYTVT